MRIEYRIHPSIGVARVGNSPNEFYLAPTGIGKRPIECDKWGNEILSKNKCLKFVTKYKDSRCRVKRQAAKFWIYRHDEKNPEGVKVDPQKEFKKIEWVVHIANKKASWYEFWEFEGDLMFGEKNSYQSCKTPHRNPDAKDRQKLIIDPGPRTLTKPRTRSEFTKKMVPAEYKFASFPKKPKKGTHIKSLGEIRTDSKNNLIVLGGFGHAGGDADIANASFGGQDTWNDDLSDGPITCTVYPKSGKPCELEAWVIVGSPNFVPEIANITTLDDMMFDVAVRKLGAMPHTFDKQKEKQYQDAYNSSFEEEYFKTYLRLFKKLGAKKAKKTAEERARNIASKKAGRVTSWKWGWNPNYKANYIRDIEPVMKRPAEYRWLANVPSMVDFAMPPFDVKDVTDKYKKQREQYLGYWRKPGYIAPGFRTAEQNLMHNYGQRTKAFSDDIEGKGIPLMPVNSGSNVITDQYVDKFATLSSTQYFMLKQWAAGKLSLSDKDDSGVHHLDHAGVGNCVGMPMCPGIEVTWTVRNPAIYSKPYCFKHRKKNYNEEGLDPAYDETRIIGYDGKGDGCEPGDLTKRMANPWQSDLFNCNLDYVTFREKYDYINRGKKSQIAPPPTFAAYWWPPSSPWDVMAGIESEEEQRAAGLISAGRQVKYRRGIHSIEEMVRAWSYLGFILNQNDGLDRIDYPYFVEKERNHKEFRLKKQARINPEWPNYLDSIYEPDFHLKNKSK